MLRAADCWDNDAHKQVAEYSSYLLWRFIQRSARESEAEEAFLNLTGLSKNDLNTLANIRFLLSAEVQTFINSTAPQIVNRLSKESISEHATVRGCVRGRIDWQKTIASRAAAGNDSSLFVCSQRSQLFDLPENRLFLYLLRLVNEKARRFASEDYLKLTWYAETSASSRWIDKVEVTAAKSSRLLRNPFTAKISRLYEVTEKIIELTKRCRPAHYKDLAAAAEQFSYCQKSPLRYLQEELKGNILEPLNKDTLFEIAVLFKTMHTAAECGWQEQQAGLIGGSSRAVSTWVKFGRELKIYYQKLPNALSQTSMYGRLMTEYGLSDKLRRPDIILELSGGKIKKIFIVEVKRSERRGYLVDGTYKLLGYLKDFGQINSAAVILKGILVAWGGIQPRACTSDSEVQLFSWNSFAGGLAEALKD